MYCPKCGTKCEENHYFCYKCGFLLPIINEFDPVATEEPAVTEEIVETPAEEIAEAIEETPVEETAEPVQEIIVPAPVAEPAPVEPVPVAPAPPKGRLFPPALILGIMMVLGLALYFLFPKITSDTPNTVDGTPWFSVIDGELFFDSDLYTGGSELVIPDTIDGQTVTVIGKDCFSGCTELTSVILPNTLAEIDDRAFSGCASLRGIFVPEGVTRIGNGAFAECGSLEAIHLPTTVTTIGDRALYHCPNLVHIFYAGTYENWKGMYSGSMPIGTWVYCEDGNFPYTRD